MLSYVDEVPGEDPDVFGKKMLDYWLTAYFTDYGMRLILPVDRCWRLDHGFYLYDGHFYDMGYAYWFTAGQYRLMWVYEERIK